MKKFAICLLILIFAGLSNAEDKPVRKVDNYIAVLDLETTGKVEKDISFPLSESIRLELVMSNKYEVIDRGNMNKILGEQKFQMSGCGSDQCMVEAGQLLGVGKIIAGSISKLGSTYYLSLSLINVQTGRIENISEDECKCEVDDLINSSKRLAKKLLGEKITEQIVAENPERKENSIAHVISAAGQEAEITASSEKKQQIAQQLEPAGEQYKEPVTGMEFVYVKGGCYQMGDTFGDGYPDEKPVHEACVDDFYIGKYEVTQGQWKAIMGNNPSGFNNCGDNCPVEKVSWNDVQEFIKKLNGRSGGGKYRLPVEAEWEYAARSGGKRERYPGGEDVGSISWYNSNSGGKTHPVGTKAPNWLGIYDMSGNVREWVEDTYSPDAYSKLQRNNPVLYTVGGSNRANRGGSWHYEAKFIRITSRFYDDPGYRSSSTGFRLAGTP